VQETRDAVTLRRTVEQRRGFGRRTGVGDRIGVWLAGGLAACAGPTPSPESVVGPDPVACHEPDAALCGRLAEIAVEASGASAVTWVEVGLWCEGQCQPGLVGRQRVLATVETATEAMAMWISLDDGRVRAVDRFDGGFVARLPGSGPAGAQAVRIQLGHCGLASGIDIDGSFWDPIGFVGGHPDAVNAAEALVTFTTPTSARLATEGGLVVDLLRHTGPKHLPGCD
jgi:hypothetical protein